LPVGRQWWDSQNFLQSFLRLVCLHRNLIPGNAKGGSITVPVTSCLTGLESAVWQLTIFVFICKNRVIQTNQTGGQWYSDPSPFSIPCLYSLNARWRKCIYFLLKQWCYNKLQKLALHRYQLRFSLRLCGLRLGW
jgi:hypothetical protein